MNLPLTRNSIMNLKTGDVTKAPEKITIEFFDPKNHMNRCILDNAGRYSLPELEALAEIERMIGRTEVKIRRKGG